MNDTTVDMDQLLDLELGDLEDLPTFAPFSKGAHRVILKMTTKEVNNNPCIEVALKLIETEELQEGQDVMESGHETNVLYQLNNPFGQGNFKELAGNFTEMVGSGKLGAIIDACSNGVECLVVTDQRSDKNDKTKVYTSIENCHVV
jgi:hypothetical protein